ncbi:MAG: hypothetical protein CMP48_15370 [Rickettsiales bacterium]|nr:hypothetical protein [Rickettsiales bacterium]
MFKWSAFPFIRLSMALATGIICSQVFQDWQFVPWHLYALIGIVVLLSVLAIRFYSIRGAVLLTMMSLVGFSLGYLHIESKYTDHYSHITNPDGLVGVVVSDQTDRTNHLRYQVEVLEVLQGDSLNKVSGKLFLYVEKGEDNSTLNYGDVVTVSKGYFEIPEPKNPNEFDYRKYLERQNIYAHAFVESHEVKILDHLALNPVLSWAYTIRGTSQSIIDELIRSPRERAIVSALMLGIKDHLDNELKTAYSSAGAIHVLAVSGLHVGIVFILLNILFKPWKERRIGRYTFMVVATAVIWMYALITGFSPSVMRAATMFTVIILSEGFQKKANIYNSLGIAAFLLIILDPFVIYAVGFQLSFIAVFGILMIYPLIYHKVHFHNRIGNYVWSIVCVSVAAQISTFPLTLYYFNQFPTYFLVSNLVVIPAASIMLYVGLVVLILGAILPAVAEVIAFIYELFIWCVNEIVLSLQVLPYPIFDWIYFDQLDVIFIYLIMLGLYQVLITYEYNLLKLTVSFCILFSSWLVWKDWSRHGQQQAVFYEVDEVVAIDVIDGLKSTLLVDTFPQSIREETYYQIDPFRLAQGLPKVEKSWQLMSQSELAVGSEQFTAIDINGIRILVVNDLSDFNFLESISADIIYLTSMSDELLSNVQCKLVVIGNGLNYYERRKAKEVCEEKGLPYHSLKEEGYLHINLENQLVLAGSESDLSLLK